MRRLTSVVALLALAGCARPPGAAHDVAPPQEPATSAAQTGDASHRTVLELIRIDDSIDPLASHASDPDRASNGIEIQAERVTIGPGPAVERHYAYAPSAGGPTADAIVRLKRWLDRIPIPAGSRFAFQEVFKLDPDLVTESSVGVRSFLLVGESVIRAGDISKTELPVMDHEGSERPIAVSLVPDGAGRLAVATGQWVRRRIAILLDGMVVNAPIVLSRISIGRIEILVRGDLADAKRVADSLRH